MFLFDGPARTIRINPADIVGLTASFHAADMYAQWKHWVVSGEGAGYPPAFRVSGGDLISESVAAGAYFFLMTDSGWRFVPPEINGFRVDIQGNLYPNRATDLIMASHAGYTTVLTQQLSNTTETVATGGGNFTAQDRADLQLARKMQTNRCVVNGDVATLYDDDEVTVLYQFRVINNGMVREPV